jgi:hypothetical protein
MIGGFIAAFIISQFIAVGSSCFHTEWGYAVASCFHGGDLHPAAGPVRGKS